MVGFDGLYEFIQEAYSEWEPATDFIFQSTRTSFEIRHDLTLLENQLPYKILYELFEFTFADAKNKQDLCEIVYCALRTSIPNTTLVFKTLN